MQALSGMQQLAAAPGFIGSRRQNTTARNSQGQILSSSLTRPPRCTLHVSSPSKSFLTLSTSSKQDDFTCGWSDDLYDSIGLFGNDGIPVGAEQLASSRSEVSQTAVGVCDRFVPLNGFALAESYILILQSCRKGKNLECAKSVYLHVCSHGLDTHKAVENYIVSMFVDCGSVEQGQHAFNKLACRREHSWTSLISGYCERGHTKHALHIFRQMQEDGEDPSVHTYCALFKASATEMNIDFGRAIHNEVMKGGVETDSLVSNSLLGMYTRCGLLTEAWFTFEGLVVQDTSSWTLLMAGYAEHGPCSEALVLFEEMKLKGLCPGILTYTCIFKACGRLGALDKGFEVHSELASKGLEGDLFIGSTLLCMYAKCVVLEEAQDIFEKMPFHDVISWNALITGYVDSGAGQEALTCYERMKQEGVYPDPVTYAGTLKACGSIADIWKGREIHTELALVAKEVDIFICSSLVGMYANCGSLMEAHDMFLKLPAKSLPVWTSLISGYADHGPAQEALDCLDQMKLQGILPDVVVLACSLKACAVSGTLDKGQEIHNDLVKRGCEKELSVGNAMVSMYAKVGLVFEARNIFDNLQIRDVVVWTALIVGYTDYGFSEEASNSLSQMQQEGVAPNKVTFVCLLRALGVSRAFIEGLEVHQELVYRGYEADLLIGNSLIAVYARCGLLEEALNIFDNLQAKDTVSWNTIIDGLAEHEFNEEALRIFEQMQDVGHSPDSVTLASIFKVCGSLGALGKGRNFHLKIKENNIHKEVAVGNSLISMYAKCGSSEEALDVFQSMPVKDVVAWSTMIKAYGMNHEGERAIQCFEDMLEQDVKPDSVTFSCLLLACSHSGLVCEGQEYLKRMRESYGILPMPDHYACVIDGLARSGHLYEAENFIMMMCSTSQVSWASLLSGCKACGEPDLGFRCFQELVEMNCGASAWFVLMEDIYATAGKKDAVRMLDDLRKHAGALKKPASAFIEINHRVHEFVVGNRGDAEVLELLSSLNARIKEHGHLPNIELTLNAVGDDKKEAALCEHAEKLALAFGLLNTAPGATLRVTKNLRMCNDCHSTSKIISKVERREIILRDNCCIHHFKDGLCSCGDSF